MHSDQSKIKINLALLRIVCFAVFCSMLVNSSNAVLLAELRLGLYLAIIVVTFPHFLWVVRILSQLCSETTISVLSNDLVSVCTFPRLPFDCMEGVSSMETSSG
jgi:hypothetical protein